MSFKCDICEKSYTRKRHLRLHTARKHTDKSKWKDQCEICGKIYADAEILERHKSSHLVKIVCPDDQCQVTFTSVSAMHKHRRTFHLETTYEQKKSEERRKSKNYNCKECGASFGKHHLLTQHLYVHTGVLPFNCSKCDKAFMTLAHRNRHEKVHDGYKCTQCSETFETWSKLRVHVKTAHPRIYKCSDCDKTFKMACRLKEHAAVHLTERRVFKCKECDRTFVRKSNLKTHVFSQHRDEKRFICEVESCGKGFAHKHSLKKHAVIHEPGYVPVVKPRKPCGRKKISIVSRLTGINPCNKIEVRVRS